MNIYAAAAVLLALSSPAASQVQVPTAAPTSPALFGCSTAGEVNAACYGVLGDGVSDDTAALQAAATEAAGKTLVLPAGDYLIDRLTLLPGTTLRGHGATILGSSGAGGPILTLAQSCSVFGLTVDGNPGFRASGPGIAIRARDCTVRDCTVRDIAQAGPDTGAGILIADQQDARAHISHCRIMRCEGDGVGMVFARHVVVDGCGISSCGDGIAWWGGDAADSTLSANTFRAGNYTISGNIIFDIDDGGIWGSLGQDITITGNAVSNTRDVGIDVEGCDRVTITGNTVRWCRRAAIASFLGSRTIVISSNVISQISHSGSPSSQPAGIYFANGNLMGALGASASRSVTVSSNDITTLRATGGPGDSVGSAGHSVPSRFLAAASNCGSAAADARSSRHSSSARATSLTPSAAVAAACSTSGQIGTS